MSCLIDRAPRFVSDAHSYHGASLVDTVNNKWEVAQIGMFCGAAIRIYQYGIEVWFSEGQHISGLGVSNSSESSLFSCRLDCLLVRCVL